MSTSLVWVAGGGKVKNKLPTALGEIFLLTVDEEETHNFDVTEASNPNVHAYIGNDRVTP